MNQVHPYAGDVSPAATWAALKSDPDAALVDVRTRPELAFVGFPELRDLDKQLITVEWSRFPSGELNPDFVTELRRAGVTESQSVYFICRSGQRSRGAAATASAAGFAAAYNVAEGFEGSLDENGHRGVGGWKSAGLPWRQL